ncbi:hypothetical protein RRG08_014976 [Elysia crispata]|uniref:Uncharacterized protein n=1 Tax=Elysia crispata TaxID=231223 RepID=A0AAE1DNR4_9GAST|nr:hypothetical protein RRG08_014976 [Elysia crispata]
MKRRESDFHIEYTEHLAGKELDGGCDEKINQESEKCLWQRGRVFDAGKLKEHDESSDNRARNLFIAASVTHAGEDGARISPHPVTYSFNLELPESCPTLYPNLKLHLNVEATRLI